MAFYIIQYFISCYNIYYIMLHIKGYIYIYIHTYTYIYVYIYYIYIHTYIYIHILYIYIYIYIYIIKYFIYMSQLSFSNITYTTTVVVLFLKKEQGTIFSKSIRGTFKKLNNILCFRFSICYCGIFQ